MKKILLAVLLSCSTFIVQAENADNSELFAELKKKDSQLFNNVYGDCSVEEMNSLLAEDFEFFHDKGGLTPSKQAFMDMLKRGPCSDNPPKSDYKSFRVLNEESFRSFPMYKNGEIYAVLQTGEHVFYESYKGQNLRLTSTAKFSDLWVLTEDKWQLGRVFSYDHLTPEEMKK